MYLHISFVDLFSIEFDFEYLSEHYIFARLFLFTYVYFVVFEDYSRLVCDTLQ